MSLPLPPYLQAAPIAGLPVTHRWGPGEAMSAFGNTNRTVEGHLAQLSFRALLGLAAALGEWMHRRFEHLHDDQEMRLAIEAMWAASIDIRYLVVDAMRFPPDTASPIHGPLQALKWEFVNAADIYGELDFGLVRYLRGDANLVNFTLPDNKAFQAWFKAVLPRVAALSAPSARDAANGDPEDAADGQAGTDPLLWGTPLPREAFDPAFPWAGADPVALIDTLLATVSATPNPFLRTPAELVAAGFGGTPYRYTGP